eukprot:11129572-Alexandrium_andersonii.AAC.1
MRHNIRGQTPKPPLRSPPFQGRGNVGSLRQLGRGLVRSWGSRRVGLIWAPTSKPGHPDQFNPCRHEHLRQSAL